MSETRPIGEQLRFNSTKTGTHILDAYLEAAERGTRTLADILSDLWNPTTGAFRNDLLQFRTIPDGTFQQRVGDYANANDGWVPVTDTFIFRNRGAYANATSYERLDLVTQAGSLYVCNIKHTSAVADVTLNTNFTLLIAAGGGGVPASRTISAGTGLTGGGDLSTNRTLTFDTTFGDGRYSLTSHSHANATTSIAGFLSAADKTKLDGIAAGAQVNVPTNLSYTASTRVLASSTGSSATLPIATTSDPGLFSAADKTKLDGVATGATANATDAALRDRATHTGTQSAATITGLATIAASGLATDLSGVLADGTLPFRLRANSFAILDWNSATDTGFYNSGRGIDGVTNTPDGGSGNIYWHGRVMRFSAVWVVQELTDIEGTSTTRGTTWRRFMQAGSWGAWHRINLAQWESDARYAALAGLNTQTFSVAAATLADHAMSRAAGDARYAALAGLNTQTFSVAAASANDHAVSRSAGDTRYARLIGATFTSSGAALTNNINTNAATRGMWGVTTGANQRWLMGKDASAEGGANAGGNWSLERYNDAGTFLGTSIYARRSDGMVQFEVAPQVVNNVIFHAGNHTSIPAATTSVAGLLAAPDKVKLDGMAVTDYQVFTASGTWTKPAGIPANAVVIVEMWGAGGGGMQHPTSPASGGGGGGYVRFELLASALAATQSVTIGAGGTGGSSPTAGGSTTFAGITANGGAAGLLSSAAGAAGGATSLGETGGSAGSYEFTGPTTVTAPPRIKAGAGGGGSGNNGGTNLQRNGGTSVFGGAGGASTGGTTGVVGSAPGGGGGAGSTTAANGARGEVRVWTMD